MIEKTEAWEIKIIILAAVFVAIGAACAFVVAPYIDGFENAGSIQARHSAR